MWKRCWADIPEEDREVVLPIFYPSSGNLSKFVASRFSNFLKRLQVFFICDGVFPKISQVTSLFAFTVSQVNNSFIYSRLRWKEDWNLRFTLSHGNMQWRKINSRRRNIKSWRPVVHSSSTISNASSTFKNSSSTLAPINSFVFCERVKGAWRHSFHAFTLIFKKFHVGERSEGSFQPLSWCTNN